MNSFVRCSASAKGLRPCIGTLGAALVLAALAATVCRPARAATIPIDLTTMSGVYLMGTTNDAPSVVDDNDGVKKVTNFYNANWVEFPFTVSEGGLYTVSGKYGTPNPPAGDTGLPVAIGIDIRKAGTEQHIGSQDLVLAATGADAAAYQPTGSFSAPGFDLAPGDYVLRVRNTSMLHSTISNRGPAYDWRGEISAGENRRLDFGSVTLTSTGALPQTGTISGKINASDLGYGVGGACVMAVPSGQDVGEPSPLWTSGYWTITDASGNYSLTVPAGASYTVVAGRPDSYQTGGTRATDVAVTAGATTTKDLSLTSRWTSTDGSGQLLVELEYFFNKIPDAVDTPWTQVAFAADGNASNQIKLSWVGGSDYVDVYADIPTGKAGDYDLTCIYSSFPGAVTQFIANPGETDESVISAELPNSSNDPNNPSNGYWMSASVKYPDPIKLRAGRNVIRALVNSGGMDFDAFKLDAHIPDVVVPGVANPRNATDVWAIGEDRSATGTGGDVMYPEKAGNSIIKLTRGSYVEIPMTFDSPGIYKVDFTTKGYGPTPLIQLDLRPANTDTHYATGDVAIPADSTVFKPVTITDIPVLQSGDYILRVRNVTQFHTTPATRNDFNGYGADGFIPNRVDFGQLTFTKTTALPGTATISGAVKSSSIGNVAVGEALVMANKPGEGAPEPSTLWQKGFWTTAAANGTYSLPVVAGTYDVQAGQAAQYAYTGRTVAATANSGQTATANIDLPSRVTQDANGHYEIHVETEYFTAKPKDTWGPGYAGSVIGLQSNGGASNILFPGWINEGDYVDVPVDVPAGAAGEYTVTDYYFNGWWEADKYPDGTVSFTANMGTGDENMISDVQPNTAPYNPDGTRQPPGAGYNTPGTKVFGTPLRLVAGHNVIRIKLDTGGSNFDAFKLTSSATFPLRPSAMRALKIAAGLEAAPAAGTAFNALDVVTDNKIDMLDAISLLQQGLR